MAVPAIAQPSLTFLPQSLLRTLRCLVLLSVAGCAQSYVQPLARTAETHLAPPPRIIVYNFNIDANDVIEYQGIVRQQPSNRNPIDRQRILGENAANILTGQLTHGLRQLKFKVESLSRSTIPGDDDLLIDGRILSVNEGNPLRRFAIGFGSGASKMAARVQVFQGSHRQRILEFATQVDSGKMPGAVATAPVGAGAPVAVGVGFAAGNALSSRLNADVTTVSLMAASSADQALRYLSEFFARQGWIDAKKVKKPRIGS